MSDYFDLPFLDGTESSSSEQTSNLEDISLEDGEQFYTLDLTTPVRNLRVIVHGHTRIDVHQIDIIG